MCSLDTGSSAFCDWDAFRENDLDNDLETDGLGSSVVVSSGDLVLVNFVADVAKVSTFRHAALICVVAILLELSYLMIVRRGKWGFMVAIVSALLRLPR